MIFKKMERIMSLWHFCCLDMSLNYHLYGFLSYVKSITQYLFEIAILKKTTICFINTKNGVIHKPYLIQTYFYIKKESSTLTSPVACQNNVRKKKKNCKTVTHFSVCLYICAVIQASFFYNPKIYILHI